MPTVKCAPQAMKGASAGITALSWLPRASRTRPCASRALTKHARPRVGQPCVSRPERLSRRLCSVDILPVRRLCVRGCHEPGSAPSDVLLKRDRETASEMRARTRNRSGDRPSPGTRPRRRATFFVKSPPPQLGRNTQHRSSHQYSVKDLRNRPSSPPSTVRSLGRTQLRWYTSDPSSGIETGRPVSLLPGPRVFPLEGCSQDRPWTALHTTYSST